MVIDSHQHFWHYNPIKHEWIDDKMAIIRRDFTPDDLKQVYAENNVDGCVAVQADQTLEETDFLIELSNNYDFIKGIVGWVDFRSQNVEAELEKYSHVNIVKGFRHVVQSEPDHNFLLRLQFLNGIAKLGQFGYAYDILVFPHQLGATLEFVKKFPNQKFVIDHIAKPYIRDGFFDGWAALMTAIAKHENVYCKVSGMVTEADYDLWTKVDIKPYLDLVLNIFGAKRTMFGSDWPVCLVAANYKRVKDLIIDYIENMSTDEQAAIMGGNANMFYNLCQTQKKTNESRIEK
ncbi:amidohydrolase family protein [Flagellimonas sp. HMM57]|uniref:amidohydrolase family protein n=1 Tax=unclassified Flagellimonas TaxID=2644544 RepID=UPI0013D4BA0D|nr:MULTISPECIES: amidohydrolase family protein [unclassified Flagellimonas]UII75371.1 amidohydrolase family protein [Flagellimonas sp. HMM57]